MADLALVEIVRRQERRHPLDRRRIVDEVLASYRGRDGEHRKSFLLPRGQGAQFAPPAMLDSQLPIKAQVPGLVN